MLSWDINLSVWINSFSGVWSWVDLFFRLITFAGPAFMVALIILRWWSTKQRSHQRHLAIACGLSTSLGLLLNQLILLVYQRPRPYELGLTHLIIDSTTDPSFPSDHATVGFAILATLYFAQDRHFLFYLGMAFLICFSRVYVGTHYVTDVLGGAMIGTVAAFIITKLYGRLKPYMRRLIEIF